MTNTLTLLDEEPGDVGGLKDLRFYFSGFAKTADIFGFSHLGEIGRMGEGECNIFVLKGDKPSAEVFTRWRNLLVTINKELQYVERTLEQVDCRILIIGDKQEIPIFRDMDEKSIDCCDVLADANMLNDYVDTHNYLAYAVDVESKFFDPMTVIDYLHRAKNGHYTPFFALAENDKSDRFSKYNVDQFLKKKVTIPEFFHAITSVLQDRENTRGTICVGESSLALREKIKLDLELDHFKVYCADDISQMNHILQLAHPEVLLLNSKWSNDDVFSFCKKIKKSNSFFKPTIIFLIEQIDSRIRNLVFRSGADDYLILPYLAEELTARIQYRLDFSSLIADAKILNYVEVLKSSATGTVVENSDSESHTVDMDTEEMPGNYKPDNNDSSAQESTTQEQARAAYSGPVRILIADDDRVVRNLLAYHFKRVGWEVTFATDGEQTERLLRDEFFHLALIDIYMPYKNGFEILQSIRSQGLNKQMKTIIMTAQNQDETARRAFALGADDFLAKPFNPDVLISRIKRFISTN